MEQAMILFAQKEKRILKMKEEVSRLGITPKLAVVVCDGYDQSSTRYVNNKKKIATEIGIECEVINIEWRGLDEETLFKNILVTLNRLNQNDKVHGIIVQLPLPLSQKKQEVICNSVYSTKDVDGFNVLNLGKTIKGLDGFISCTPLGIMNMLDDYNIEVEGKRVAVIGRSKHVGMPLVNLLINRGATVVSCNSKTKEIEKILREQDVVISAVGKPKIWNKDHFNKNVTVIDVGINVDNNNKLCGDLDVEDVKTKISAYSPVPGGVGIMTVLALMENVIKSCKKYKKIG